MQHTVNANIAHSISPIYLILSLPLVFPQLPRKVPEDGVTLGQNPPIEFNHGNTAYRVHFCNAAFLVLGVFFEAIADVVVGYAGIFPEKTDDLSSAARLVVKVVHCRHTTDDMIRIGLGEASLRGRHDD